MIKTPQLKDVKDTAITGTEVLGGFLGAHALRNAIKSTNKMVNPGIAGAAFIAHAAFKNAHAKSLLLGLFAYFGVKSLGDLKGAAVAGLDGFDGIKDILNKIVPSLGEADFETIEGADLAAAEAELLGLMNGGAAEFTPYTEVASVNGVSGL